MFETLCTKINLGKPPPLVLLTFLGIFLCNYLYGACAGHMFHPLEHSSFLPVQLPVCLVQSLDRLYVPLLYTCSSAGSS